MVLLRCPRCRLQFNAVTGHLVVCPHCGQEGGHAPPTRAAFAGAGAPQGPWTENRQWEPAAASRDHLPLVAMVLGLVSFPAWVLGLGWLVALAAIGLGIYCLAAGVGRRAGRGLAIAGIVLGALGLVAPLLAVLLLFRMMGL